MATIRGGDIDQFVFAGREFDVAAEANITYRLSGKTPENRMTGNRKRYALTRNKMGGMDAVPIIINAERAYLEFLQSHADGEAYPLQISLASGVVYSGDMALEGELDGNTGEGQAEATFRGENFEQI